MSARVWLVGAVAVAGLATASALDLISGLQ
jgi:hypothetical protein